MPWLIFNQLEKNMGLDIKSDFVTCENKSVDQPTNLHSLVNLFVCFDSLHPSQQFFSHVETGLPGLKQY